jgi:hypothetical protein
VTLAVKKRVLSVEGLYFDFRGRLATGELLTSCDLQPTMILPSPTNTDITWGNFAVNLSGPLSPPPPQAQIPTAMGVSTVASGGVLPADPTSPSSILPDGTVGTIYEFSFKATTSAVIDGLNRVIDEQYQLWISNDDYPAYWSSQFELNRRFGTSQVNQWADPENTGQQSVILPNVWSAVAEATDEFRCRLRGSACGIISPDTAARSFVLRLNVTRLAAYILYTSRGVKDTSDEEGRNRLSTAYKQSQRFLQQCRAGQIRLVDGDVGVTSHPFVVTPVQPYLSPLGPLKTPEQMSQLNQFSELQGIPSYNVWFNSFDQFGWAGTW